MKVVAQFAITMRGGNKAAIISAHSCAEPPVSHSRCRHVNLTSDTRQCDDKGDHDDQKTFYRMDFVHVLPSSVYFADTFGDNQRSRGF